MTLFAQLQARTGPSTEIGVGAAVLRSVRRAIFALGAAAMLPIASFAQTSPSTVMDHPAVLELYTAQGCASCPPADDMMLELARRDDVIALSLHVDYWDYIGWVDSFAHPDYSQRQQRYARRYGHSTIYTPQVVINGIDIMEGFRVMQVMESLAMHRARDAMISLELTRLDDGGLGISAQPTDGLAPVVAMASRRSATPNAVVGTLSMGEPEQEAAAMPEAPAPAMPSGRVTTSAGQFSIQLVRYNPQDEVEIMGGENAGLTAIYANIVTSWQEIGQWDMASPLDVTVPLEGDEPVVVLIQEAGQGEIIAAARLR